MKLPETTQYAMLAGGCFWCLVGPFEVEAGVLEVLSGYSGGPRPNPTYEEVSGGESGHREVVRIAFDPERITFSKLLDIYWRQIDPEDDGGQFADRGDQYRTAIYYFNEAQKEAAEKSKKALTQSNKFERVVTEILPAQAFYPAEEHHQDYYQKKPLQYERYKEGSGRGPFLRKTWDKP